MAGRRRSTALVAALVSAVFLVLALVLHQQGLDRADKLSSVIGAFSGIFAILLTILQSIGPGAEPRPADPAIAESGAPAPGGRGRRWPERLLTLTDRLLGGPERRVQRLTERLARGFQSDEASPSLARLYRRAIRLALRLDPAAARSVHTAYDDRIAEPLYTAAFTARDAAWLGAAVPAGPADALRVVVDIANRLGLRRVRDDARDRLVIVTAEGADPAAVIDTLEHLRRRNVLDEHTVRRAVTVYGRRRSLEAERDRWSRLFLALPAPLVPDLFPVALLLDRMDDAHRLMATPAEREQFMDRCLRSSDPATVRLALDQPYRPEHEASFRKLNIHMGALLLARHQPADALLYMREAGDTAGQSICHEQLRQYREAIEACPDDQPDRIAELVGRRLDEFDDMLRRRQFTEVAEETVALRKRLRQVKPKTEGLLRCRRYLARHLEQVVAAGRGYFRRRLDDQPRDGRDEVYRQWSLFEEAAGELDAAAERAVDGNLARRASGLYRRNDRYGDAERVLRGDRSPESLRERAKARLAGNDVVGAAECLAEAGDWSEAVDLFIRDDRRSDAKQLLVDALGDDALQDRRLAEILRANAEFRELAELCLRGLARPDLAATATGELRRLSRERALPDTVQQRVDEALDTIDGRGRQAFETKVAGYVARARTEIGREYSDIFGLDLGTSTCVVAIYGGDPPGVHLCRWRGRDHFPSTISIDRDGNEHTGLSGEELDANGIVQHFAETKMEMGTDVMLDGRPAGTDEPVKVRYRPEEVAARLITHGRTVVETFLAGRVRQRVAELATADIGEARPDWLGWMDQNYQLTVERSRAIVTVPARFPLKANKATRDACRIAGVELVRLIHEPTAACLAATRHGEKVDGRVVLVDFGAGTLDISLVEVSENFYDVQKILGQYRFGSRDFNRAIELELTRQLERQGLQGLDAQSVKRAVTLAAERFKIQLSNVERVESPITGPGGTAIVQLTRARLDQILGTDYRTLRSYCREVEHRPGDRMILVGGPMHAPPIRAVVKDALGIQELPIGEWRTAVAWGAALQGAVLSRRLRTILLQDVTPLPLGIAVADGQDGQRFTTLVEANSRIPLKRTQVFSTHADNQTSVDIQVYNGDLEPETRIGSFVLADIPPAKRGEPEIEVAFDIDESCILTVTATDRKTRRERSVQFTDTTLLSPPDVDAMRDRLRRARREREQRDKFRELAAALGALADLAETSRAGQAWLELEGRRARFVVPRTSRPAEVQRELAALFNEGAAHKARLDAAVARLDRYRGDVRAFLTDRPADPDRALATGAALLEQTTGAHQEFTKLLARVVAWNRLLAQEAAVNTGSRQRFRQLHDVGDYRRALEGVDYARLGEPADLERALHCLAETRQAAEYETLLRRCAAALGHVLLDPDRPADLLAERPALVLAVRAVRADGVSVLGTGTATADRTAVVSAHWLRTAAAGVDGAEPRLKAGLRRGGPVAATRRDGGPPRTAVLELERPLGTPPPRVGYHATVRVGDRIWVPTRGNGSADWTVVSGIVDTFRHDPGHDRPLYGLEIELSPRSQGGPLINDLGEVVGLVVAEGGSDRAFAVGLHPGDFPAGTRGQRR
ncbi:Hsp70 family protein [Dactylosporangium sp. NPDC051541]|uniref:Hsp70 family protein n=1 Tax=Dactylosporangium sp. NPDC051541 TaxID=3363977 RepID=UPI00379023F7